MKAAVQFISSACERLHNKIISLIPYYDQAFDQDIYGSPADYHPFDDDDDDDNISMQRPFSTYPSQSTQSTYPSYATNQQFIEIENSNIPCMTVLGSYIPAEPVQTQSTETVQPATGALLSTSLRVLTTAPEISGPANTPTNTGPAITTTNADSRCQHDQHDDRIPTTQAIDHRSLFSNQINDLWTFQERDREYSEPLLGEYNS